MIDRGRRRRRDRRRNRLRQRRRGRDTVLSWVFIIASFLILVSLVSGGVYLAKRKAAERLSAAEGAAERTASGENGGREQSGRLPVRPGDGGTGVSFGDGAGTGNSGFSLGDGSGTGTEASGADRSDAAGTGEPGFNGVGAGNEKLPLSQGAGAEEILSFMTLEDKVAQLFIITPEQLTGVSRVYNAGTATKEAINRHPVGGLIYFSGNIETPQQVKKMLANVKRYSEERSGVPAFLCVDEEGGSSVARIAGNAAFPVKRFEDMAKLGALREPAKAYEVGDTIGAYLSELGFTVNFAPVADVLSDEGNKLLKDRSIGTDSGLVAQYVAEEVKGLEKHGVKAVIKHYPGHGAAGGDTHEGYAYTDKSLGELLSEDLIPFQAGIETGVDFIMTSHIAAPAITGDRTPASMSPMLLTDVLRESMGYDGIIITDSLSMKAVTQQYTPAQAAVASLTAGADLLLMPADYQSAYEGVLDAVRTGVLSQERIDQSVLRILRVKVSLNQGV